jgi:hypothetical protein
VLFEDFESGTLGVFRSPGDPAWLPDNSLTHGGAYAARAENVDFLADQRLILRGDIPIPADAVQATLSFWHAYRFDRDQDTEFDGGVLEVSVDGRRWTDAGANIVSGGYNGTISTCCSNPLEGREAWVRTNPRYTEVVVDLLPYAGQAVRFRFRLGSDLSGGAKGWWIDDLEVVIAQSGCSAQPPQLRLDVDPSETPGATPPPAPGGTVIPPPPTPKETTPAPTPTITATATPTITPAPKARTRNDPSLAPGLATGYRPWRAAASGGPGGRAPRRV